MPAEMNDLELTRLCAEAMGIPLSFVKVKKRADDMAYWPLTDDEQAMALVKKMDLSINRGGQATHEAWWGVKTVGIRQVVNKDLNRAICECVAKLQQAKTK